MSHIVPFYIDGYRFQHVEEEDELNELTRGYWRVMSESATLGWREQDWVQCEINESNLPFAVFDPSGDFFGTWVLYRMRPTNEDPHVVSALPGPMYPDINARIPEPAFAPNGMVVNGTDIIEAGVQAGFFWRRVFGTMEHFLDNPMLFEDGDTLILDHWRFPLVEDQDPMQHEWRDVRFAFDDYFKNEVLYREDGTPIKSLNVMRPEADPTRPRGHFGPADA